MDSNYHFVVFNYPDTKGWKMDNPDGYYFICIEDLLDEENVTVVNYPLEGKSLFLKVVHRILQSLRVRLGKFLLFDLLIRMFYPKYFPHFSINKEFCFIFISDIWDIKYMRFLKDKYPKCKIVMALRDLVKTKWFYNDLVESKLIDHWFSYDEGDCDRFGMTYFSEFESQIDISQNSNVQKSDVFFTGRAKQRLPVLIECYDYLTSLGLDCLFIILDAPEDQKEERVGIIYTKTFMTYRKMLEYSIRSKCLLDINQDGAMGYTSRFLEAVIYNKLLLTNTRGIEKHPLYDSRYIKEFKSITEVDPQFFFGKDDVRYNYNNEFSPLNFLRIVREVVSNKE